MFQPFAVARRRLDLLARGGQCSFGFAIPCPGGGDRAGVDPPEAVQHRPVAARVQQAAIVMLAVDFDQMGRDLAEQRGGGGLAVDEARLPPSALT